MMQIREDADRLVYRRFIRLRAEPGRVYAEVEDITNAADLAATREQVQQLAGLFSTTALKFNTLGMRSPELRIL